MRRAVSSSISRYAASFPGFKRSRWIRRIGEGCTCAESCMPSPVKNIKALSIVQHILAVLVSLPVDRVPEAPAHRRHAVSVPCLGPRHGVGLPLRRGRNDRCIARAEPGGAWTAAKECVEPRPARTPRDGAGEGGAQGALDGCGGLRGARPE